jgi:hypothetical protein
LNRIKQPLALVSIILSIITLSAALTRTGSARLAGAGELSKLRGQAAVEFLKDNDLHEPLAATAATGAFVEEARLLANDGVSQDNMGFSVAVSGDTAVVGAPADAVNSKNRQGSVYVYVRSGTSWTQQQKLLASDGAANDEFGYSVGIVGDTIAVGRHNTQTGVNRTRGAVYIFKRTGATWAEQQILTASDGVEGDIFGTSLALENDTLIIGAQQKNIGSNFFQGAAYIFTRATSSTSFAQQARLTANDGGFADIFGYAVAVSGDTAIVGAVGGAGSGAASGRGWAYVYVRSGSSWTQQQKLLASDGASGDAFGYSVGVSGETAIIGARADVVGSSGEVGSAYVFTRTGATWSEQQKLTGAETTPRNDFFGNSVAISGETIAIGSPAHEYLPGLTNHGAVYVFSRSGTVWTRQQKLVHGDAGADALGQAVAFDGSSIIAGAPSKASARGAAYGFAREAVDPNRINGAETGQSSFSGRSVDIDGDTAIMSADFDSIDGTFNGTRTGAAYIFTRTGVTWTQQARLVPPDGAYNDHFSSSVAISGNTAIIGAYDHKVGANASQGAAYVYTRTGTTWTLQQKLTAADGAASDSFGYAVDIAGDTAVVAAVGDDILATNDNRGSAYVFARTGATWSEQARFTAHSDKAGSSFGVDVAVSGHTVIVGCSLETIGTTQNQGAAYVFTRAGATWTEQQRLFKATGGENGDGFGVAVGIDGETLVVGAAGFSAVGNKGTAYVYVRANSAWTQQQQLLSSDLDFNDQLGKAVDISGDTIILGAFGKNSNQGAAYVFKRANSSWTQQQKLFAADGSQADFFGVSVGVSGDYAIAGAHGDDVAGKQEQGSAYIFALGGSTATPTPTPTASPTPTTASVQFSAASYEFNESAERATITITRSGDPTGAVSVELRTIDDPAAVRCDDIVNNAGAAYARCDYATTVETVSWPAGDTQPRQVTIPLINDAHVEGAENVQLRLVGAQGASAGAPSNATLVILDNDAAGSTANPIFNTTFFVRMNYLDFLSREPEAAEPWSAVLNNCSDVNNNPTCDRLTVSSAFFRSQEFQLKGLYIYLLYKSALNRRPTYDEVIPDMRSVTGQTPEEVYQKKAAFVAAFAARQEFTNLYGASSHQAFVDTLLGRYSLQQITTEDPATPDGTAQVTLTRQQLVAGLASSSYTRAQVLRALVQSNEVEAAEFNGAFVAMQYYGYLRRTPEEGGYNNWLNYLNNNPNDFRKMVDGFMNSVEYRLRFGQP